MAFHLKKKKKKTSFLSKIVSMIPLYSPKSYLSPSNVSFICFQMALNSLYQRAPVLCFYNCRQTSFGYESLLYSTHKLLQFFLIIYAFRSQVLPSQSVKMALIWKALPCKKKSLQIKKNESLINYKCLKGIKKVQIQSRLSFQYNIQGCCSLQTWFQVQYKYQETLYSSFKYLGACNHLGKE